MKTLFVSLIATLIFHSTYSQEEQTWFDFWVGEWEVTWDDGEGKTGSGTNKIVRILDNTVIQENFTAREGTLKGYLGTSISVYNPKTKTWHQGYADNQGAYFNFIGVREGDKRIFKTLPVLRGDKTFVQRMVFYDINPSSLTWDWESSEDGGQTWKLNWRIKYTRLKN